MVRLIGFGLILVLPLKLCKLNMTNNNCINEHKGLKDFFKTKYFKMHRKLCRISASFCNILSKLPNDSFTVFSYFLFHSN